MTNQDLSTTSLSKDDLLIMQHLRAGDRRAVAAIEKRYGDELRLFSRRMLSDPVSGEDVVQDVLETCCRLEAGSLPANSVRGWLYQVVRRRCIDYQRKQHDKAPAAARKARAVQPSFDNAVDPLTTPAGKALKRDRALRILGVLRELDDDLRSVLLMRYFQELPREEIAEAIGLSLAGTKARLSKAMEILRDKLRQFDDSMLT